MLAVAQDAYGKPGDFNAAKFGYIYVVGQQDSKPVYTPQLADDKLASVTSIAAGDAVEIEWRQPRDIHVVKMDFDGAAPKAKDIEVLYYYHIWPDNGSGGWSRVDDPFNGKFIPAATTATTAANSLRFGFKPLEKGENPKIKNFGANWRTTFKMKFVFNTPVRLKQLQCVTNSEWKTAQLMIDLGSQKWGSQVEARNAEITSMSPSGSSAALVKIRYADNPNRLSPDRGYAIVRRGGQGVDFSFFVDDVVRDGVVKVRDVDAFVSDVSRGLSRADWKQPADSWKATVMDAVAAMPEQTFGNAMKTMPAKAPREAHLGLPDLRQEISVDARGWIFVSGQALRGPGKDKDRSTATHAERDALLRNYRVSIGEKPTDYVKPADVKRSLAQGYLPVINGKWLVGDIACSESIFVTALDPTVLKKSLEIPKTPAQKMGRDCKAANLGTGVLGDEPIVAVSRMELRNNSKESRVATLWLTPTPYFAMALDKDGMLLLDYSTRPSAGKDLVPTWGQIVTNGKGKLEFLKDFVSEGAEDGEKQNVVKYTVTLAPGEKHAVALKVPYVEQLTPTEISQLKDVDCDKSMKKVVSLWKTRLAASISEYKVPEPELVNLYRANLWHALITNDRDVDTGLYEHGAATFGYNVYVNETSMVARSLEMRGEHEEARKIFEPFLACQGEKPLPGNFESQDGLIYAAAPKDDKHGYTAQGYNMHHGFGLWVATEHYFWTRDKEYLNAIAPNLVAGCDWVTRERRATMAMSPDGTKPLEYGLAPAGDLEDVAEYLYWYPTNAYYYLGMKCSADALAEIGHPEAARIAKDAEAYRSDIMASMRESVATSPVVRLLNGEYVPCVPPRTDVITTEKEGWIREALYSTLHLVDCGLLKPDELMATWILDDLEDRIFMGKVSGYGLKDPKGQFFTFGGFNPQPNLLDTTIAYLKRGQPANFLRAFYNTYASSVYTDVECFAEWVPKFGEGGGPLYKTPDESKFIQWMRQMLVLESGDKLLIGAGVPRDWMARGKVVELHDAPTYFGVLSMKIVSGVADGKITAELSLPARNPAKTAVVSLRHPKGEKITSVTVNGKAWSAFDPTADTITLPGNSGKVTIVAGY